MEKTTEQVQVDDDKEVQAIQKGEIVKDESSKNGRYSSVWLLFLVMLALNAGLYWHWFQQNKVNSQVDQALNEVAESVATAPSFFEQEIAVLDEQFQSTVEVLQSEQSSLMDELDDLRSKQNLTSKDAEYYWVLAEVNYLLNVANQQVLLVGNAGGALAAIDIADSRIEALSDHRLHPLRALFAEEKLALSAVKNVDLEGVILQLQSALHAVDNLQIIFDPSVGTDKLVPTLQAESSDWQGAVNRVWQQVKSLVVIRHQQDGVAAVLMPEQRYFLYQNLRLKLESAQFALLSRRHSIYDAQLNAASEWLQQYFVGDERDAMLASIAGLREHNIDSSMPDISASLTWLRGFKP